MRAWDNQPPAIGLLRRGQEMPGRDASTSFAFGRRRLTGRLNSRAALSPRMLRLACSDRNGSVVTDDGGSKSQCGQSDANSSCVSAFMDSIVACVSLRFE